MRHVLIALRPPCHFLDDELRRLSAASFCHSEAMHCFVYRRMTPLLAPPAFEPQACGVVAHKRCVHSAL